MSFCKCDDCKEFGMATKKAKPGAKFVTKAQVYTLITDILANLNPVLYGDRIKIADKAVTGSNSAIFGTVKNANR